MEDDISYILKLFIEKHKYYTGGFQKAVSDEILKLIENNRELKRHLIKRIEYTNKLEKDLFENASNYVIPKSKIEAKIEELEIMYDGLPKNPKEHLHSKTEYKIVIGVLQELLGKGVENGN